jgi:hypothetical protein
MTCGEAVELGPAMQNQVEVFSVRAPLAMMSKDGEQSYGTSRR